MLGNVLPGLRELRAPLAAGYLWLLFAWLVWGDRISQARRRETADLRRTPLDRFFELEPVVSSIGLAIVASVAAYIVGSIVIDVQTGIGERIADLVKRFGPVRWRQRARLALTEAGNSMLKRWELARAVELDEQFADLREAAERDAEASVRAMQDDYDEAWAQLAAGQRRSTVGLEAREAGKVRDRQFAPAVSRILAPALSFDPRGLRSIEVTGARVL